MAGTFGVEVNGSKPPPKPFAVLLKELHHLGTRTRPSVADMSALAVHLEEFGKDITALHARTVAQMSPPAEVEVKTAPKGKDRKKKGGTTRSTAGDDS